MAEKDRKTVSTVTATDGTLNRINSDGKKEDGLAKRGRPVQSIDSEFQSYSRYNKFTSEERERERWTVHAWRARVRDLIPKLANFAVHNHQ